MMRHATTAWMIPTAMKDSASDVESRDGRATGDEHGGKRDHGPDQPPPIAERTVAVLDNSILARLGRQERFYVVADLLDVVAHWAEMGFELGPSDIGATVHLIIP